MSRDYTFTTLNDKDFENLVRDLLQEKEDVLFESFTSGADKGIDLRHSLCKKRNIIVQAKHWPGSTYSTLLSNIKRVEAEKVKKLKPARYVFTTSIGLTPKRKEEIKAAFHPYIRSESDIYGRDEINNLLGLYPKIETDHFKLWYCSTNILKEVLNNAIEGRSRDFVRNLVPKMKLFVAAEVYDVAAKQLGEKNLLLIKGEPGVGKTTLAEALTFHLLKDGFKVTIVASVDEAEQAYLDGQRQVFFFDDFLGSNYLAISSASDSGQRHSNFFRRIAGDKTKKLILTTRTTILNKGYEDYYHLEKDWLSIREFELHLKAYSRLDKAKILYNHIFFSDLPAEYVDQLFSNRSYMSVIKHQNYSPRVVFYLTRPEIVEFISSDAYLPFVKKSLNEPTEIWRSAFERQIDDHSRLLLVTLFSLGAESELKRLRQAFVERIRDEANKGLPYKHDAFNKAVKLLQGGFIQTEVTSDGRATIKFSNPSVSDFFLEMFRSDIEKAKDVLRSAIYVEQFESRFLVSKKSFNIWKSEYDFADLVSILDARAPILLKYHPDQNIFLDLYRYKMQLEYTGTVSIDEDQLAKSISNLEEVEIGRREYAYLRAFVRSCTLERKVLSVDNPGIVNAIILILKSYFDLEELEEVNAIVSNNYECLKEWALVHVKDQEIQEIIDDYLDDAFHEFVEDHCRNESEPSDIVALIEDEISEWEFQIQKAGFDATRASFIDADEVAEEIAAENIERMHAEEWRAESLRESGWRGANSEDNAIHALFTR